MVGLKEVYSGIFCNQISLPKNPLKYLNCYIIPSKERNLIIDTGFNRPECEKDFLNGIQKLNIDMAKTDILLTHLHSDHIGLASLAEKMGAKIFTGAKEESAVRVIGTKKYWDFFYRLMQMYGLSKYGLRVEDHPGYQYRPSEMIHSLILKEGDVLEVSGYSFKVVDIPGHTSGQIGLYEMNHKLFFCGDHILGNITPNIIAWGTDNSDLERYMENLKKIYDYEIDLMLPGHRELITDHKARIRELLFHHEQRLAEIIEILSESGEKSPCEVAAKMTWDLKIENWESFPKAQKWFSAGEAMAHLEYLYDLGKIERREKESVMYYRGKSN